jgi:hypothetical protein
VTDQNFFFEKWDREAPKFDAVMDALPTIGSTIVRTRIRGRQRRW